MNNVLSLQSHQKNSTMFKVCSLVIHPSTTLKHSNCLGSATKWALKTAQALLDSALPDWAAKCCRIQLGHT